MLEEELKAALGHARDARLKAPAKPGATALGLGNGETPTSREPTRGRRDGRRRDGQKVLPAQKRMGGEREAARRALLDDLTIPSAKKPKLAIVDVARDPEKALVSLWSRIKRPSTARCTKSETSLRMRRRGSPTRSRPDVRNASSSVSVTSLDDLLGQSLQATMQRGEVCRGRLKDQAQRKG